MEIQLYPKMVLRKFLYLILFLLVANIFGIVSKFYFGHDSVYGLVPLFDFNAEMNVPTFYSSIALVLVSILLSFIALTHKKNNASYLSWVGLAIVFLFLSVDEISSIHENFSSPARELFSSSGVFYFTWVIPYGVALVIFAIVYLKFLINLPRNIMYLFVISGVTFISGALGFEMIGGSHADLYGMDNLLYSLIYTCEEFLEMLGIVIFIYTLLKYIVSEFKVLTIAITENKS